MIRHTGKHTFWCEPCDHVARAGNFGKPHCPGCGEEMRDMLFWHPGPKGNRMKNDPRYEAKHARRPRNPGRVLLERLSR